MNYIDGHETIAKYGDTGTLVKFADGFSRWPEPCVGHEIAQELKPRMEMYYKLDCTKEGDALADVIKEIIKRCK